MTNKQESLALLVRMARSKRDSVARKAKKNKNLLSIAGRLDNMVEVNLRHFKKSLVKTDSKVEPVMKEHKDLIHG